MMGGGGATYLTLRALELGGNLGKHLVEYAQRTGEPFDGRHRQSEIAGNICEHNECRLSIGARPCRNALSTASSPKEHSSASQKTPKTLPTAAGTTSETHEKHLMPCVCPEVHF